METVYNGQKIPILFSAGWVGYEQGETTEQFLERADRTLYAEKRAGKIRDREPAVVREAPIGPEELRRWVTGTPPVTHT